MLKRKWTTYQLLEQHHNWLAVNKPSGLASIQERDETEPSLHHLLEEKIRQKLWVVHRLDKETSGLILFAKNEETHQQLSLLFQNRTIEKTYLGLTAGCPYPSDGQIEAAISPKPNSNIMMIHAKGKPSTTKYKVIQNFGLISLVEFHPLTGRTHQIRLHAKQFGHPLLCDKLYGDSKEIFLSECKKNFKLQRTKEEIPILSRLALHSFRLRFEYHKVLYSLEAPLYKDMQALIKQLEKI